MPQNKVPTYVAEEALVMPAVAEDTEGESKGGVSIPVFEATKVPLIDVEKAQGEPGTEFSRPGCTRSK